MTLQHHPNYWEEKKTPHADLERIKPLIFSIGLVITLLLVNQAMEYKSYDAVGTQVSVRKTENFEELLEVPATTIPPPVAPAIQATTLVEVKDEEKIKDEIKINMDMEFNDKTAVQQYVVSIEPAKTEEKEVSEEIFVVVEQSAAPRDGMAAFYRYVNENIHYPVQARRMNIEGKVYVEFVVEKDGSITLIHVVKGVGAGCDEEAIRIIERMPPWSAGRQRGKPCRQRIVLPLYFKLA